MKTRSYFFLAFFAVLMLGCQLTTPMTGPQPTATAPAPACEICFDYSGLATRLMVETVPAVPESSPDGPYWEGTPQFRRLTLLGYPVTQSLRQPQLFVFAIADLAPANEAMAKYAEDLKTLLQTKSAGQQIPFLPISNESQLFRARMEFVDFKGGQGVLFLTQINQGLGPVNNSELIYAFQGLTNDGKYYVSAILPVTHPDLPADFETGMKTMPPVEEYVKYHSDMIDWLYNQPADSFKPSLEVLSNMIRSIEIK